MNAQLTIRQTGLTITLSVTGSLAQPLPAGHGLTGMAERAALCGGQCVARPGPQGFEVIATLPLRSPATYPGRT